jgi:hypothetical protein
MSGRSWTGSKRRIVPEVASLVARLERGRDTARRRLLEALDQGGARLD